MFMIVNLGENLMKGSSSSPPSLILLHHLVLLSNAKWVNAGINTREGCATIVLRMFLCQQEMTPRRRPGILKEHCGNNSCYHWHLVSIVEVITTKRRGQCNSLPTQRNETGSKEEQEPGKFKNTDICAQELRVKNKKRLKLKPWSKKPAHTATFCQDTTRSHL